MQNDTVLFARAVHESVWQSLMNAQREPEKQDYWFAHADKLERKFTTQYGRHYTDFLKSTHIHAN